MTQRLYRVGGDVPEAVRAQLRTTFPPRFPNLHLLHLTWEDKVDESHWFDPQWQDCTLYGLHSGPTSQAFLANLAGHKRNPQGRLLFVAFCTADGVKPWDARHIHPDGVVMLPNPITFGIALQLRPMWQSPVLRVPAGA